MNHATSGRWIRQGNRIVLLPARGEGMQEEVAGPLSPASAIHPAIDVHAQYALVRMSKSDAPTRAAALGMLQAVKAKQLGIYKVDQQVPAMRAKKLGGWWKVIPQGQNAAVFLDPGQPFAHMPLIVFRDTVKNAPALLDVALRAAWDTYQALGSCQVPGSGGWQADVTPGRTPGNLVPPMPCSTPSPPPITVPLLRHMHKPTPGAPAVRMVPEAMDPGFSTPGALHEELNRLLTTDPRYSALRNGAAAVIVDLTGARRFQPDIATFRPNAAFDGDTVPLMSAVYAARQLEFDLQEMVDANNITSMAGLVAEADRQWRMRSGQPQIEKLFRSNTPPGVRLSIRPTAELETLITCTIRAGSRWAASVLLERLGLKYVGSVVVQSGIFHPVRGGLWLSRGYASKSDVSDCAVAGTLPTAVQRPLKAFHDHNATALGAATLLTLMYQGRLVDPVSSGVIAADLADGCTVMDAPPRKPAPGLTGLCGFDSPAGVLHDAQIVTPPSGSSDRATYVVVLLSEGVNSDALFREFIADADRLVRDNNP